MYLNFNFKINLLKIDFDFKYVKSFFQWRNKQKGIWREEI